MEGTATTVMMLRSVDSEDCANAKQLTSEVIQQADQLLQLQQVQSEESSLDSCSGSPQRTEPPGRLLSAFSSPDDSQTFFSRVTSASSSGYSPQQSPLQSALHFSPVSTPSRGENLLPMTPGSFSFSTDTSSLRSSTLPTTPNRPVSLPLSNRTFVSVGSPSKSDASSKASQRTRAERIAAAKAKRRAELRQLPSASLQPKTSVSEPVVEKEQQQQVEQSNQEEEDDHEHLQKDLQEQFAEEHEVEQQEQQEHLELQEHIQAQFDHEKELDRTSQQVEQQQEHVHSAELDHSCLDEPKPVQQEEPACDTQQVEQEQNQASQPLEENVQLPPHPNRASLPRSPIGETAQSSTPAKTKTRRSKHSKGKSKSGSDVDSDWSSDAIESVSSSVNLALDKLKEMAKPYMGQSANTDDAAPEVVNTSTEVSTEGVPDVDTASSSSGPDFSGLDLKELERELRAKKPDETKEQRETVEATKTDDAQQPQRQVSRNFSNSSYDALGIPKPALLTHDPSLLLNLRKPVPRTGGPPIVRTRGVPSQREAMGLPPPHNDKHSHPHKGSEVGSNFSGSNGSATSSMKASRAVTPIMRMRGTGGEQDTAASEVMAPAVTAQVDIQKSPMDRNEEDHIAKQKRWKEKRKLVEQQREKEKKLLASEAAPRRRKRRSKSRRNSQHDDASTSTRSHRQFAAAFPSCQNELTSMLEKFVRVRCGNLEDAFFEEDSDDSTQGSEYETDDDGTDVSADYTDNTDPDDSIARAKTSVDAGTMTSAVSQASIAVGTMTSARNKGRSIGINTSSATSATTDEKEKGKDAVGIKDKNFIRAFISDATKSGFVLMLHEKNRKKSLNRPTKTTAFVKRGAPATNGRFVGPSLIWKATDGREIGGVDIFDIRSLDKATALQLEDYPLAMPGRSLFLRMNKGKDYVFEAENQDDALRFVHGMRWVVARLSFNLIIGNLSVSCELLDVERSGDDENGKFPRTLKEESHWTMAMTDVTSHLVDKAATM